MMHSDVKYGLTVVSRNIDDPSRGTVVSGLERTPEFGMVAVEWAADYVSEHEPKDLCEAPKLELAPMERDSIVMAIGALRRQYPFHCRAADTLEAML